MLFHGSHFDQFFMDRFCFGLTCPVFKRVYQANPEHSPVVLFSYGVDLPDSVGGRLLISFFFFF